MLLVVSGLLAPRLQAQGGEGTITGAVLDTSKAVVPGAQITLVDQTSGEKRGSVSNGSGYFSFVAVPPGTYSVQVSHDGFATVQRKNIVLHSNDAITVSGLILKAASASTTVEVSAQAADVIPTDTGEKSSLIEAKQIQNLAIVGRSAVELLNILPGVVNTGYTGETTAFNQGVGSFNVNGTRSDQLAIVNDGANTIDPGCNCGSAVTPNVDMVAEMKVQTSNFSAENSQGPVVIQTVDKSGGSKYHGEAYYSLRDYKMNANDALNNAQGAPRPKSKFQYPGFNVGGPVTIPGTSFNKNHDKMFFFAGLEWMRQGVDTKLHRGAVPTAGMRNGDFRDIADPNNPGKSLMALAGGDVANLPCTPNAAGAVAGYCTGPYQIASSQIDKGGQILMNVFPMPNVDPLTHQGNNFQTDIINPENRTQQLVRVDYNFSQNTKLYSRFNHESETDPYPYGLWWDVSNVPYPGNVVGQNKSNSLSTSLTNVLNPTLTNELVVAVTRLDLPNTLSAANKVSRKALGYPYRGIYAPGEDQVPSTINWGGGMSSEWNPGGFAPVMFANKWINSVSDNISKVSGTHLFKFGAYYEHLTNDQPTNNSDQGNAIFSSWSGPTNNGYANMLMGVPSMFTQNTANIVGNMAENEFDLYAQDSWKATPRLTLNYGLRMYHEPFMYDKHGRIGVFNTAKYDPNAPISAYSGLLTNQMDKRVPKSGFPSTTALWAPNFGFAYDITGRGTTVVRGGFGTNYYRDQGNVFFGAVGNPPYELNASVCCGNSFSQLDQINPAAQATGLTVLDQHSSKVPVTYSYSLTLSKRLPFATVMEASYVGNSSHNLANGGLNINTVPLGAEFPDIAAGNTNPGSSVDQKYRPYGVYQGINQDSHVFTAHYDSLQLTASRQTGRVNYSVAYTFSKALGANAGGTGGSGLVSYDPFNTRGHNWGLLPFDRTHILSLSYNVTMPNFGTKYLNGNAIADGVLNGWQLSGISQYQSGGPMNIVPSGFPNGRLITGTPDQPVQPLLTCNPAKSLGPQQIFNPACFSAPTAAGQNGVFELPYIRGPWYNNNDLSAFKNFALGKDENRKLQLRFEAFNVANHPLWNFVSGDPGLIVNYATGKDANGNSIATGPLTASSLANAGKLTQKTGHRIVQVAVKFFF